MRIPSIAKLPVSIGHTPEELAITGRHREISNDDLPLYCPTKDSSLWNAHPRVYLPIEKQSEVLCPYCGTTYRLRDSTV